MKNKHLQVENNQLISDNKELKKLYNEFISKCKEFDLKYGSVDTAKKMMEFKGKCVLLIDRSIIK